MIRFAIVLAACASPAHEAPPANRTTAPVIGDAELLARTVLADWAAVPDAGLLPPDGPVLVLQTIGEHGEKLTAASLPSGPRPFVLRSDEALQAQADATNTNVAYVRISVSFDGDSTAYVTSGVDILLPKSSTAIKMCCCSTSIEYKKQAGQWRASGQRMSMCS
jgi:hypothetical protein